jgi:hypothetical protein
VTLKIKERLPDGSISEAIKHVLLIFVEAALKVHAGVSSRSSVTHDIGGVALRLLESWLLKRRLLWRLVGRLRAFLERTVSRLSGLSPLGASFMRAVAVGGNGLCLT